MMIPSRSAHRRTIALSALLADALFSAPRLDELRQLRPAQPEAELREPALLARPEPWLSLVPDRFHRLRQRTGQAGLREQLPTARGRSGTPRRERASERGARCVDLSFEAISNTYLLDERD